MRIHHRIAGAALVAGAGACATGSTVQSGVGDRLLDHPPYYAGTRVATDTAPIGHVPVAYQRGATQEAMFDPAGGPGTATAALLSDLTAYLDSLGVTTRLAVGGMPPATPPDVQFSCETDPAGDCLMGPGALGRGDIRMRLAVGRPAPDWVAWARAAMDSAHVVRLLVITLEVSQYRVEQRGMKGDKMIELGSDYTVRLPWLTSLETPVHVLQLTGALVGRDGRAIRIGAEGMLARKTSLPLSALGAQALIPDDVVAELRAARREDLSGEPLVWQAALRMLVTRLTGR
jgi:hypothetical protein